MMTKNGSLAMFLKKVVCLIAILTPFVAVVLWINNTTNEAMADNVRLEVKTDFESLDDKFVGNKQFIEFKDQFRNFREVQNHRFDEIDRDLNRILDKLVELAE